MFFKSFDSPLTELILHEFNFDGRTFKELILLV